MPPPLISDVNVIVDAEEGGLLEDSFRLPYQLTVPDILFAEELKEKHSYLIKMGLVCTELNEKSMRYAYKLADQTNKLSRNDCFASALAKQKQCPLLTGDEMLRETAKREGIAVGGTIWLVDELIRHQITSVDQAKSAYEKMRLSGCRLPWKTAQQRLDKLLSLD